MYDAIENGGTYTADEIGEVCSVERGRSRESWEEEGWTVVWRRR